MWVISLINLFASFVAMYLTFTVTSNEFWVVNGVTYKEVYDINLIDALRFGLYSICFVTFCLSCSGCGLVRNSSGKANKILSALFSLLTGGGLIYISIPIWWTANNINHDIDLYCEGGFP